MKRFNDWIKLKWKQVWCLHVWSERGRSPEYANINEGRILDGRRYKVYRCVYCNKHICTRDMQITPFDSSPKGIRGIV